MPHIIQVRCNGPNKDVNEVDLDLYKPGIIVAAFRLSVGVSGRSTEGPVKKPPQRLVLPCQYCTVGKVIITRDMIQQAEKDEKAKKPKKP